MERHYNVDIESMFSHKKLLESEFYLKHELDKMQNQGAVKTLLIPDETSLLTSLQLVTLSGLVMQFSCKWDTYPTYEKAQTSDSKLHFEL